MIQDGYLQSVQYHLQFVVRWSILDRNKQSKAEANTLAGTSGLVLGQDAI